LVLYPLKTGGSLQWNNGFEVVKLGPLTNILALMIQ